MLEYRLGPKYHYPVQQLDAQRAIRYVRVNAEKFGIAPDRIGVWGFSAGGHLASLTGTHFDSGDINASDPIDRVSSRPDFMILEYPVIESLGSAAERSFQQLLGEHPSQELVRSVSTDLEVKSNTPPTFLQLSTDDDIVSAENSVLILHVPAQSWRAFGNAYLSIRRAWIWIGAVGRRCGRRGSWDG